MNSGRQAEKPGRASFPRTAKLLNPVEFKRVFKRNVVSSDRFFRVLGRPNEEQFCRLGMAVSKQVDKHAVGRNRIKRVVRESFRHFFESPKTAVGSEQKETGKSAGNAVEGTVKNVKGKRHFFDLVVLPRRECATICNRQLFQSLDAHWERISAALQENGVQ
jgi:ribonuclease P protein component